MKCRLTNKKNSEHSWTLRYYTPLRLLLIKNNIIIKIEFTNAE